MRTFWMIMIPSLALVSGCEIANVGDSCGGVGTSCEEGSRCVDGTCTPCGGLNEYCCAEAGGSAEICDGNVACVGATYDYGVCKGECGAIGLSCCDGGECPTSGTCYLGDCIDDGASDGCHDPFGDPHKVYVIVGCGESDPLTFTTKTPEKAEACRQELFTTYPNADICPLDGAPQSLHACGVSKDPELLPNSVHFAYCDAAALDQCKLTACNNCDWTEPTNGTCPSGE